MPKSLKLKPLIASTKKHLSEFREQYKSDDSENNISDSYDIFVTNLHKDNEDFKEYRDSLLNETSIQKVDSDRLEEIMESIFNLEKPESIKERSDRVRQIQNSLFWEAIQDFEESLEKLEKEATKLKVDDVDSDSSSRKR